MSPGVAASRRDWRWLAFPLHFVLIVSLLPRALDWDGIAFLERTAPLRFDDYAHLLYAPVLRASSLLAAPFGATPELAARLCSALAAPLALVWLWGVLARGGSRLSALATAGLVLTTPLLWKRAAQVEPMAPAMASLVLALKAATAYGESRTARRLVLAWGAWMLATGFHVVSLLAGPWLVFHALGPAGRPPRFHLAVLAGSLAMSVLVVLLAGSLSDLGTFADYARGFLPAPASASEALDVVAGNVWIGFRILTEEGLFLTLAGVVGLILGAWRCPRSLVSPALLAGPYLVAFALLGRPRVGLMAPVFLALALCCAAGHRVFGAGRSRAWLTAALLGALAVQVSLTLPRIIERAQAPDQMKEDAMLLSSVLPPSSVMMAGPAGRHIRWYTSAAVILLPELFLRARARESRGMKIIDFLWEEARRHSRLGRTVYITSEAIRYLRQRWGLSDAGAVFKGHAVIEARSDPFLGLVHVVDGGEVTGED